MAEQGEHRGPVVTGLADVDPLPSMLGGLVGMVVLGVGALAMDGQATSVLAAGAGLLFVYGVVVVAAKVCHLRHAARPLSKTLPGFARVPNPCEPGEYRATRESRGGWGGPQKPSSATSAPGSAAGA